jgi:hypothetical protein
MPVTEGRESQPRRGWHPLDVLGRLLMRLTSRRLAEDEARWLIGPSAERDVVGHNWVERMAADLGGHTSVGPDHGLLSSFTDLAGSEFDPTEVDPRIADFYEHTTRRRMDLWSQWSAYAWPFGAMITTLFSQRLQQLSLPMRPLDVSYGMDSTVVHVHDKGRIGRRGGLAAEHAQDRIHYLQRSVREPNPAGQHPAEHTGGLSTSAGIGPGVPPADR